MLNLLYFQTHFTIDQIDNDVALVEWENQSLSTVDLSVIPNPKEGHTYVFQALKRRQSDCVITQSNPIIIQCSQQQWIFPLDLNGKDQTDWSVNNPWIAQPITWRIYEVEPLVYYEESLPLY